MMLDGDCSRFTLVDPPPAASFYYWRSFSASPLFLAGGLDSTEDLASLFFLLLGTFFPSESCSVDRIGRNTMAGPRGVITVLVPAIRVENHICSSPRLLLVLSGRFHGSHYHHAPQIQMLHYSV